MRFDIDRAVAKSMASRLSDFLAANPRQKLTRSSAIEAVARMLGFNSRNEMLARLDRTSASPETTPDETALRQTARNDDTTPLDTASTQCDQALKSLVGELEWACARDLVETTRRFAPDVDDFDEAAQTPPEDGEEYALIEVENDWTRKIRRGNPAWRVAIQGYSSEWDETALEVRQDVDQATALVLVNGAIPTARDIWDGRLAPDRAELSATTKPTPEPEPDLRSKADATREDLHRIFLGLIERCAHTLFEEAQRIAPDEDDFREAINQEDADGMTAKLSAEEVWESELGHRTLYPVAIETFSEEVESAREIRWDKRDAIALALVNESFDRARELWEERLQQRIGTTPEEHDVDVSCWAPGSLQVELPGDRVAEIEAEVLCLATIQVEASDETQALRRAQERLEHENFAMIWTPRPDRGVRNARWASDVQGEDLDGYLAREQNLVEDHWEIDLDRAHDFRADQTVDRR